MRLITESGSVYEVTKSALGKFHKREGTNMGCAFVGEMRHKLVRDLIEGRRQLVGSRTPEGSLAIGFTGSTATLCPCEPRVGMRILSVIKKGEGFEWTRYSTPIVEIV